MLDTDQTALMDERVAEVCEAYNVGQARWGTMYPAPVKRGQRWQRLITNNGTQSGCHTWLDRHNGLIAYGAWVSVTKNRQGVPAYRYDLLDEDVFATLMVRVLTEHHFWLYEDAVTRACH